MRPWIWWSLLGPVLFLSAAPVRAAPSVTLRLENASFHETLRALSEKTGLLFRGQDGAGDEKHRDRAGLRTRLEWREAPLGRVIREVCRTFAQTAYSNGDGYSFTPGLLRARRETESGGIAVAVTSAGQSEYREKTPGPEPARIERSLDLRLAFRAAGGDGDLLGPVSRVAVVDPAGRSREIRSPEYNEGPGLPDERYLSVSLPWDGEHPPRLLRLEGEVSVYREAAEHRVEIPLSRDESRTKDEAPDYRAGPVRVRLTRLEGQRRTALRLRLDWPAASPVVLHEVSPLRLRVKGPEGRWARLYCYRRSVGEHHAEFEGVGVAPSSPAVLEVSVPTRSAASTVVAFRIESLELPFGRPHALRAAPLGLRLPAGPRAPKQAANPLPRGLASPDGGTLRVALPRPSPGESLNAAVGLSRRQADGTWSALHWIERETVSEPFRIQGLAPGTYRCQVRYWRRLPDGSTIPQQAPGEPVEVRVRKGEETPVPLREVRTP